MLWGTGKSLLVKCLPQLNEIISSVVTIQVDRLATLAHSVILSLSGGEVSLANYYLVRTRLMRNPVIKKWSSCLRMNSCLGPQANEQQDQQLHPSTRTCKHTLEETYLQLAYFYYNH